MGCLSIETRCAAACCASRTASVGGEVSSPHAQLAGEAATDVKLAYLLLQVFTNARSSADGTSTVLLGV
jgi:hypothetical protein